MTILISAFCRERYLLMSWGISLFEPELLNDDNLSEVAQALREIFEDSDGDDISGDFSVKIIYVDGRKPRVYGYLVRAEDDEGDDKDVVSYQHSDWRTPPTISSELVLEFDEVTLRFETREDWLVEWYADDYCVSLTASRPLGDIQQVIISADKS